MVRPVKFAHVVYMTRRFDEMLSWYRNVFEAETVYQRLRFSPTMMSIIGSLSPTSIS